MVALDGLPQAVPEANSDLSLRLAKLLGALGSIMTSSRLDAEKEALLLDIRAEVVQLRQALEGVKAA